MKKHNRLLTSFAAMMLFILVSGLNLVQAQTANTGAITGVVKDEKGGAIPGATVKVINIGTNAERSTQTSGEGTYEIPQLVPGIYRLEVEASGFGKYTVE